MPRIPTSGLDRGISEDVRVATPQQDDSLARAVGNLGKAGEQLFAQLKKKQDTSDFLDWRHEYDETFRESRADFIQDLDRANLDGSYDYERVGPDGQPVQRTGNVFADRDRMSLSMSQLAAKGDGLVMSEEAKRHYSSKENQMGAKLSLDITSHMNKKRRSSVDSKLNLQMNNMILDMGSGITPTDEDLKNMMDKLSGGSMESSVLGNDIIAEKRGRFLASMGQAIVESMKEHGESPALKSILQKLNGQFDERTKARLEVGLADAQESYVQKQASKAETVFKTVAKIDSIEDYTNVSSGIMPVVKEYASIGQMTSGKAEDVISTLAKSAHYNERLLSGITVGQLDSMGEAEKLFEQMKDTPLVQQMGEDNFKEALFREVASVDRGASELLKSNPDQFALMYDKSIIEKVSKTRDLFGGLTELHTLYNKGNISKSRENYALAPIVAMEKDFFNFKKRPQEPKSIMDHVDSWDTGFPAMIRERTVSQLAVAGAIPKYTVPMHKLPSGSGLSAKIATAAVGYEQNRQHASFAVEGEGKRLGVTVKEVDRLVDSALEDHFPVPTFGQATDRVMHHGVHEAAKMMIFNRVTSGRGEKPVSVNEIGSITNEVIDEFKDNFISATGDKGSVIFPKKSFPVSGNSLMTMEQQMRPVLDDPATIVDFIDLELDYEGMREALVGDGLSGSTPSVDTLNQIIAEKDPERKKQIFKEFFGDKLNLGRDNKFNDKVAVQFGPTDLPMPLLLKAPLPERTSEGRKVIKNPDGTISTEQTETVEIDGRFYNVPTLFDGKKVSTDKAVAIIKKSGFTDPDTGRKLTGFSSTDEAVQAAQVRSNKLGRELNPKIPLTMQDSDFLKLVQKKTRADLTEELKNLEERLPKFTEGATYRRNVMQKRIEELKSALGSGRSPASVNDPSGGATFPPKSLLKLRKEFLASPFKGAHISREIKKLQKTETDSKKLRAMEALEKSDVIGNIRKTLDSFAKEVTKISKESGISEEDIENAVRRAIEAGR